ncbi:hypothetical protein V6N11_024405 [Hibiscus sabdariffa]|uniref:Uncharacterized protein n=1 Tax=Hibiscus sabdariffa TaxID=183260 RepID=A0ABR2NFB9_9ROSI
MVVSERRRVYRSGGGDDFLPRWLLRSFRSLRGRSGETKERTREGTLAIVERWPQFVEELVGRSSNGGAWRLEQWRLRLMGLSSALFRREKNY